MRLCFRIGKVYNNNTTLKGYSATSCDGTGTGGKADGYCIKGHKATE